ncbi:MAG TPA: hypothetical protein P5205_11480 [Candidatus Paceibacterota bacterium]|nr:hypothetical protein [Verrucomicrobiota bacterium]HSA10979.1 hypothetical protein [Candidatus Paceibacterota bacterium]
MKTKTLPQSIGSAALAALLLIAPPALHAQSPAPSGTVLTIAGNGSPGFSGDGGPATNAMIHGVNGLAVGPDGTLYFADTGNFRVRALDPASGIVRTVAGNGGIGDTGNGGPATLAQLNLPERLALDAAGTLFICDTVNFRIRQVVPVSGIITTIAGSGFNGLSTGDGGPATNASFTDMAFVAADHLGNVFATDDHRLIRRTDALTGIITTIAGGGAGAPGAGLATNMAFTDLAGMAVGYAGELFFSGNYRVFQLDLASGLMAPYAGGPSGGYGGDGGPATNAVFGGITALAVPPGGGLLIADSGNARIRYVVPDSISLTNDSGQTAFHLPWVSALAGGLTVANNTNLASVNMGSLTTVGGNLTLGPNAPDTVVDMTSLTDYGCGTNEVTMTLDGGTVQVTNGLTLCTNGTLTGSATLDGSVTNSGTIEPGSSPGSFNIAGSLVLLPGSRLRLELGGPEAGSQYDQLNVSNAVTYGGTVTVQLINGFTPSAGQVFQLINTPSRLGAFAGASLPALPAGLTWTNRLAADGSIAVVAQEVPPQLLNPLVLGNGSFQFGFTNPAGASFTVLTATNPALPLSNWTALGPPAEPSPGQYQFTDAQHTNDARRFYRLSKP